MKLKLFIVSFFIAILSHAQSIEVKWGDDIASPRKTTITEIFPGKDFSMFTIRTKYSLFGGTEYFLEKYDDKNYKQIYSVELKFPQYHGKDVNFQSIMFVGNKLYIFSNYYSRDDDKNFCFYSEVNQATGTILGGLNELDQISATKKRNSGSFTISRSDDSTKVLVYRDEPFDKYANEKFNYKVFDENMKLIHNSSITLPYIDKKFSVSNFRVDNDGNVYMLASIEKESQDRQWRKPWYRYEVLAYFYKTKELKEYNIDLGDRYVTEILFRVDYTNKSLLTAGYYSEKSSGGLKGQFFLSLDMESKKITKSGYKDFSVEFMTNFMSERRAKKGKETGSFELDYLILTEDGGAVLTSEQRYVVQHCTTDPKTGVTRCYYTYYNNGIILSKISKAGEFEWTSLVPKLQVSSGGTFYSSYHLTTLNNKIFLIYNDNAKNLLIKDYKKLKNYKVGGKGIVTLAVVDAKGNVNRQVMMTQKEDSKTIISPKNAVYVKDGVSILYAARGKKVKFGKMVIK